MTITREELFGPVLVLIGYESDDDAIRIANDPTCGLYGYVNSPDLERARAVARRIRSGVVEVQPIGMDIRAPFGGYKRSGNGREYGRRHIAVCMLRTCSTPNLGVSSLHEPLHPDPQRA